MFDKNQLLKNTKEYFNTLNIIFYLLVGVPLMLFCILYLKFEGQGGLQQTAQGNFSFFLHALIPLTTLACIAGAYVYYRKSRKQVKPETPLREKLLFFYRISMIQYGILFAANMLPVIGLYLSGEQLFPALYAVALVAFSINRPTIHRLIKALRLNKEERHIIIHNQNLNES